MNSKTTKADIIDGSKLAKKLQNLLEEKIFYLTNKLKIIPTLAIIQIGDNHASNTYINNKQKAAKAIGIETIIIKLPQEISTEILIKIITEQNNNHLVSGIIVQLPLPMHIERHLILAAIDPQKDVDGFHPLNVGYLHIGIRQGFIPCTALGIVELIKSCDEPISGKHVVIIGRSNIVSKPLMALLLSHDATVTICHSKTLELASITTKADIVVAAVGSPKKFNSQYFKKNSIVIDVGINRLGEELKIIGDVDFDDVSNHVKYISPVPGGVGPMTIYFLLHNVVKAACLQHKVIEFDD